MGEIAIPQTTAAALDPVWLAKVLGREVAAVEVVETIKTVATKIRFRVDFAGGGEGAYCLKGLLDVDEMTARGGPTMVREADFYGQVAAHVDVRVPVCVAPVIDREAQQAVIIMRDLIADGARFCSALEPFSANETAASLSQIARLHAGRGLLETMPWIDRRIASLAKAEYVTLEQLQAMLDGPRGEGLPPQTRNAANLVAAMRALSARDAERPQFLVHGDAHAGNIFRNSDGTGLIDWQLLQRGGWALDVAYHIAAVLPVEVAEREERNLLEHYLGQMRGLGHAMPDADEAWAQYREAMTYGYYLWSITRRVDPEIITLFVGRLGAAVTRHDSFSIG
jgi:hypothetical protein